MTCTPSRAASQVHGSSLVGFFLGPGVDFFTGRLALHSAAQCPSLLQLSPAVGLGYLSVVWGVPLLMERLSPPVSQLVFVLGQVDFHFFHQDILSMGGGGAPKDAEVINFITQPILEAANENVLQPVSQHTRSQNSWVYSATPLAAKGSYCLRRVAMKQLRFLSYGVLSLWRVTIHRATGPSRANSP